MERQEAFTRIIELSMKWQDPAHWRIMAQCEADWNNLRQQVTTDRSMSRTPAPFDADLFQDSAKQNQQAADIHRRDLLSMRGELVDMQNLVRTHAPTLLAMTVTAADVSGEITETQKDKLKQLEGDVRAMLLAPAAMPVEQTVNQTIESVKTDESQTKSNSDKKPWSELATDLKNRWFSEMRRRQQWIPRRRFLSDFLNGKEGSRDKWKELSVGTEDRRFQDNPEEWKAEADALKASLKGVQKTRR